jgi:hypothetical protein
MDFERYVTARDLFYLAALFLGAGCGCFLNRYKTGAGTRLRNLSLTISLCLFSGTAAAFFISIIYSNWIILMETALYLPMGILASLMVLVLRFPRAAAFPIFLLSCVFVIFTGYIIRIPVVDGSGRLRINRDGNNIVHISAAAPNESPQRTNDDISLAFQATEGAGLEISSFCIVPSKAFPLFGGVRRGLITEIRHNQTIYTHPQSGFFRNFLKLIFSSLEASEKLEIRKLSPGTQLTVYFESTGLVFR